jgi:hypothetical protein
MREKDSSGKALNMSDTQEHNKHGNYIFHLDLQN